MRAAIYARVSTRLCPYRGIGRSGPDPECRLVGNECERVVERQDSAERSGRSPSVAAPPQHLKPVRLLLGSGVVVSSSRDQAGDQGTEQGFAASAHVVHELEEAEVKRQLVLRDAPMRAQPGAQQRPKAFHGVDVHLAEPVPVLVAGILAPGVADGLVPIAPGWQASIDAVFVRVDEGARGDRGGDDRLDRGLLHVGQHMQHHLAAALDQPEDWRLVLLQRAAARRTCQFAAAPKPPLLATSFDCPLCPATT